MNYSQFANQQIINAFYKAAKELNTLGWQLLVDASLTHLVNNRTAPYTDTPIEDLPIAQHIKDAVIKHLTETTPLPQNTVLMNADMRLPVPWVSQLDASAPDGADCGHACVLMLLKYYDSTALGGASRTIVSNMTVQQLVTAMKSIDVERGRPPRNNNYTSDQDLIDLAFRFGLTLHKTNTAFSDPGQSLQYLAVKRPVIILVNYADLGFKPHLASGID